MSSITEVIILAEGPTEKYFIGKILAPYLVGQNIFLYPILLSKPGQKGGDVRFSRAQRDIHNHLRQRQDTYITLMVDYYGIGKDWPGFKESKQHTQHTKKAEIMNRETANAVQTLFPEQNCVHRFISYVSMHEIEALYFSDPTALAHKTNIEQAKIESILRECCEPEAINDNAATAPSKRLEKLSSRFKKTTTGIEIAKTVGIPRMRECCPLFDAWVSKIESLNH
jgi:hypothetical protein